MAEEFNIEEDLPEWDQIKKKARDIVEVSLLTVGASYEGLQPASREGIEVGISAGMTAFLEEFKLPLATEIARRRGENGNGN